MTPEAEEQQGEPYLYSEIDEDDFGLKIMTPGALEQHLMIRERFSF